ncbi:MAG: hypothetical protein RLZZ238_2298 [Planctomycetota bacterium]
MPSNAPDDFTLLLNRAAEGDGGAVGEVWRHSYPELRAMARGLRPRVPQASTRAPTPTTIIHESFVKTFGREGEPGSHSWDSRAHFFGSVARAMSQFLIDWRRHTNRRKRGSGKAPASFQEQLHGDAGSGSDGGDTAEWMPHLLDALERLRIHAPQIAEVVWMRCVVRLSLEDTASLLGIRPRTVSKRWNLGRAMLRRDLSRSHEPE